MKFFCSSIHRCCLQQTVALFVVVFVTMVVPPVSSDAVANLRSRCSNRRFQPAYSCELYNSSLLAVEYESFGLMECGGTYTLQQTAPAPKVTLSAATTTTSNLYTVLMVDTSESDSVHPILHFAAVNIPGSALLEGLDTSAVPGNETVFDHNGPSPPNFLRLFPRQRRQLFLYEWIVARQDTPSRRDAPERVTNPIQFDFRQFLEGTTIEASSHFLSGFCVR